MSYTKQDPRRNLAPLDNCARIVHNIISNEEEHDLPTHYPIQAMHKVQRVETGNTVLFSPVAELVVMVLGYVQKCIRSHIPTSKKKIFRWYEAMCAV